MIDFDDLRAKAEDFLEDHADQVDSGLDKAAKAAGKKYGHGSQLEQAADKLEDLLPGGEEQQGRHAQRPGGQHGGQHGGGQHAGGQRGGGQHRPGQQGPRRRP
jgi:hypothetical protein